MNTKTMSLCAVLLSCASAQAAQPESKSGGYFLPACKASQDENDGANVFAQGICAGIASSLLTYGNEMSEPLKFCPPDEATNGQATLVIIKFLEQNPQRLSESFLRLGAEALRRAWPCKEKPRRSRRG